ncbi:hypothetical protein K3495_g14564 [Podosphaera aphanis]|nr:hypothetical protein K3495_g14564 [Podosphaera aphanis]
MAEKQSNTSEPVTILGLNKKVNDNLNSIDGRFKYLEKKINQAELTNSEHFANFEERFDNFKKRFDNFEKRFNQSDKQANDIEVLLHVTDRLGLSQVVVGNGRSKCGGKCITMGSWLSYGRFRRMQ